LFTGETGLDFVDFVVKICAERGNSSAAAADGSALGVEGANVLQLLAATPPVEPVLWPHLLEHLLQPEVTYIVGVGLGEAIMCFNCYLAPPVTYLLLEV
jgi:hypothetical protein